jgi:diguanylate cyclase (GGDEF)-like protein/PAS domain S-box-containing protein
VCRFEQLDPAVFQYGCHWFLLNQNPVQLVVGFGSRESGGVRMALTSGDPVKRADLPLSLIGPASRRRTLRVLFVHGDAAVAEHCVQELRSAHFKVSADVVLTPEQFAGRLRSKCYDVVLAEYPSANWEGSQALDSLHVKDKQIPCIFLTHTTELETLAKLITEGAADCVGMDHIGHLPVAVRRALSENNLRGERDQSEKKLRHSEARYRALVGNLNYGICRCNSKGKFLDVNQALVTMLGYASREELLAANHASEILCNASQRAQLLGRTPGKDGEDGSDPLELEWKRKDGTTLKVRLSGREVGNAGGMGSYEIIVEDVTEQRKLEDHLRQEAAKDSLTGLANYRHLVETVDMEIKRSERTAREFAILFLDLDGLKTINDRFGHIVGSQALCRLADVLCICSRNIDTPARFGGDEFALVLPETGREAASLVAKRVCESLGGDGKEPTLSVSIGVAIYPRDGEKLDVLLGAADAALYSMKARTGKSRDARTLSVEKGRTGSYLNYD